jgi:hypothetical protein
MFETTQEFREKVMLGEYSAFILKAIFTSGIKVTKLLGKN